MPSLTDIGPLGKDIQALAAQMRSLGKRRGVPNRLGPFCGLLTGSSKFIPISSKREGTKRAFLGGSAARVEGSIPDAWGINDGNLDRRSIKRMTMWTAMTCAPLSRCLPARIVCCSGASRWTYPYYPADKIVSIPIGSDLTVHGPDLAARSRDNVGCTGRLRNTSTAKT